MGPLRRALLLAHAATAAVVLSGAAQAPSTPEAPAPLFASDSTLALTLVADFEALEDDRGEGRPERRGTLRYTGEDGEPVEIAVGVRTRGNFRLRRTTCSFPNLRIRFDTAAAGNVGTLFEQQSVLKLVGHCRGGGEFEQNTLEEYLAYRLYNALTDVSFRVRLARFTYVDENGRQEPVVRYGFLLEDLGLLAGRLGGLPIEVDALNPLHLDPVASARLELFEYMIGNTDFSVVRSHNSEVVRLPDGTYQAVPYDFDFSGLVNAPYANPAPELGIESVRERAYRGFCRPGVDGTSIYDFFLERRGRFGEILRGQKELDARAADRAVSYLDEFFHLIESTRARRAAIDRSCRSVPPG